MKRSVTFQAIGGFLLGTLFVLVFHPQEGSVWGPTFFGVPYGLAVWLIPVAAAASAAAGCLLVLRDPDRHDLPVFRFGLGVGVLAFLFYAGLHISLFLGSTRDIELTLSFMLALAVFGGLLVLPLLCLVSGAIELLLRRHAEP